jgi:hypothetical protein
MTVARSRCGIPFVGFSWGVPWPPPQKMLRRRVVKTVTYTSNSNLCTKELVVLPVLSTFEGAYTPTNTTGGSAKTT